MSITKLIGEQFHNPKGLFGRFCMGIIMPLFNRKLWISTFQNIKENKKVMEIGFGSGKLIKKVAKKSQICFGIDPSSTAIYQASKRNKNFIKREIVKLKNGTEKQIPFNEMFDIVYTINTIYFWDNIDDGLNNIKSKLASNGIFINAFYTKNYLDTLAYTKKGYKKYTLEEIVNMTRNNGFVTKVITVKKNKSYLVIGTNILENN
ncbi:MAG: class I SAM-dependent methyltransferase [Acholeplasmatales bacterium]|jgi:ubiquinone/menaquinone biosynthesis C-methylase UbiE|nr:class I SAM-dependent methyltransferase [Acholeplasmatales bacterium]